MIALVRLVHGPGATFEDRLRAMMSLFTINSALFLLYQDRRPEVDRFVGDIPVAEATREEAIEAAQHVALEICSTDRPAHPDGLSCSRGAHRPARAPERPALPNGPRPRAALAPLPPPPLPGDQKSVTPRAAR